MVFARGCTPIQAPGTSRGTPPAPAAGRPYRARSGAQTESPGWRPGLVWIVSDPEPGPDVPRRMRLPRGPAWTSGGIPEPATPDPCVARPARAGHDMTTIPNPTTRPDHATKKRGDEAWASSSPRSRRTRETRPAHAPCRPAADPAQPAIFGPVGGRERALPGPAQDPQSERPASRRGEPGNLRRRTARGRKLTASRCQHALRRRLTSGASAAPAPPA